MDERTIGSGETLLYEAPRVVATYEADDILAEAETGSTILSY